MDADFWKTNPNAPFATLVEIASTCCHPEADQDSWDQLVEAIQFAEPPEWVRTFKEELREALRDPHQLPARALFEAAKYGDGSDEAFLWRLWRDLYGDESV